MSAPRLGEDWQTTLRQLPLNWNSYNSKPISAAAIQTVAGFSVVPTSEGGIQLEVHQDKYDIEIDVSPEGKVTAVFVEAL